LFKKPKIGLALGGGGARGMAHIGVLKILEQEKIPIDYIAGTSAGALIGAMYALNPNARDVERRMLDYINSPDFKKIRLEQIVKGKDTDSLFSHVVTFLKERVIINLAPSRTSIVSNKKLKGIFDGLIDNTIIENTKIPFCAVASDLISGKETVIKSGDMITAIISSGSIPGFLPPVSMSDYYLLDGSVIQNVPVQAVLQLGADVVIAIDVSQKLEIKLEFDNILEIMSRTGQMTSKALTELQLKQADIVLKPKVGQYHWAEFSQINVIIKEGIKEAERLLPQIKKKITRKRFKELFRLKRNQALSKLIVTN